MKGRRSSFGAGVLLFVAVATGLFGLLLGMWIQSGPNEPHEQDSGEEATLAPTGLPDVKPPERVILIGIDTLRADRLSSYGYERETSPNLDRLAAEEGIRFEKAYAPSSWTLPSMTSLFTSLHPPQHLVEDRGSRLASDVPTLAGAFASQGWLTAGFVTHIYVSSLFGLDSGFSEWRELSIDWNFREGQQLRADALNDYVLRWLDQHQDQRFFLYIHYFDPHWDYDPPPPYDRHFIDPDYTGRARGTFGYLRRFLDEERLVSPADLRRINDLYDGEILWTDSQLGRLFARLRERGLWDDTLLAVTSDHGEEFQDHGSFHHIRTLYEEVLRVPLLVKLPGGRPAEWRTTVTERVPLIDLSTTLVHLSGIDVPETFEGRTLLPLMRASGEDRPIFARTLRHTEGRAALIESGMKVIRVNEGEGSRIELYDLNADPGEKRSLTESELERASRLAAQVDVWLEEMRASRPGLGEANLPVVLTPEQREHLRSLGYVQ